MITMSIEEWVEHNGLGRMLHDFKTHIEVMVPDINGSDRDDLLRLLMISVRANSDKIK